MARPFPRSLIPKLPAVSAQPVSLPPEESSSPQEPVEEDWRLMLVNPDHLLPDDFTVELAMTSYGYEVDARIVEPLTAMIGGGRPPTG